MAKRIELRLVATDESVDVVACDAARAGRKRVLGKTWDAENECWTVTGEADVVACVGGETSGDLSYYAKIVKQGYLAPADAATAALIGGKVPSSPKRAPKSAEGAS